MENLKKFLPSFLGALAAVLIVLGLAWFWSNVAVGGLPAGTGASGQTSTFISGLDIKGSTTVESTLNVQGTTTQNGANFVWGGARVEVRKMEMNTASNTSCSFRNPVQASTTPRFLDVNWTLATSVPIFFEVGTSTQLTGTTSRWYVGQVPANQHRTYSLTFGEGISTSSPGYDAGARQFVLGPDEFLNVQYGGASDTRSPGDCEAYFFGF